MLARVLKAPYPVVLLLGGLALGFLPGVPSIRMPPNLVLLVFLPPILYAAASFSSPRGLVKNLRPIIFLAFVLVLITATVVAAVAHAAIGLPWAAAFVLGAIVAPTDPAAATAVAGRLGAPRQIVSILEGESLINDGTALVLYHIALGVVITGKFSLPGAILEFVLYSVGGIGIGLVIGWIVAWMRRRIEDRLIEVTVSLLTSYAAYLPANALGVSGVLAAVAAGLYLGWQSPRMSTARNRLQTTEVWEILPFLLNAVLFILIGFQFFNILARIPSAYSTFSVLLYAVFVSLTVVGTRPLGIFPMVYVPRYLSRRVREREPYVSWRYTTVIAYTGMRGAVSLALAFAIPLHTQSGKPFPARPLILLLTFCVILATLVPQGLSLPWLIRRLGLAGEGGAEEREEAEARLRDLYERRRQRFAAQLSTEQPENGEEVDYEKRSQASQRLTRELLNAERTALLRLRSEGRISDTVRRRVERDLDLEDVRLEI
jgi:CPA1 family monovalent cation:H+ antiporter